VDGDNEIARNKDKHKNNRFIETSSQSMEWYGSYQRPMNESIDPWLVIRWQSLESVLDKQYYE